MSTQPRPQHFVVDGSNIATEGRSRPSLDQLNEAVLAFMEQYPDTTITVVVDATFGHRIDPAEVPIFDEAVANNELVTPPAGAVGRGDAFVLSIANKASSGVLSNDSFQEFHGQYPWLFDEGRLIGGKPVPHIGWVFVDRVPVRGPKSRLSVRQAEAGGDIQAEKKRASDRIREKGLSGRRSKKSAPEPAKGRSRNTSAADESPSKPARKSASGARGASRAGGTADSAPAPKGDQVNELMPFLEFVQRCPVGSRVQATVSRYASHGAYAAFAVDGDEVEIYLPLRNMGDPPPTSARKVLALGETVTLVIVGLRPDRRSIDAAFEGHAAAVLAEQGLDPAMISDAPPRLPEPKKAVNNSGRSKAAAKKTAARKTSASKSAPTKTTAKKSAAKSTAAKTTGAKKAAAKTSTAKSTAAKSTAAKKATAKTSATKTTAANTTAAKTTGAKTAAAKSTAAKKATAKTSATKSTAAKTAAAKSTAAKKAAKTSAKKSTAAKTAAAKKATAKTSATKATASKKSAAKKSTSPKAGATRAAKKTSSPSAATSTGNSTGPKGARAAAKKSVRGATKT